MIEVRGLTSENNAHVLNDITLGVNNGEIYLLLCSREECTQAFADLLAGFQNITTGEFLLDSRAVTPVIGKPLTVIYRFDEPGFFEPDLRLRDIVDFYCRVGNLDRKRVLEILLLFNIFEEDLKKKMRHAHPVDYKIVCLALLLGKGHDNIVINDFIRGEEKEFELKFNRVLLQLKKEGKAILYLTGDIFYAYRIADKVSFIKNGYLVPAEPIESKDLKELDAMEVYKKYLS
jgi:ABC-2 type transport system ATP-binding protein